MSCWERLFRRYAEAGVLFIPPVVGRSHSKQFERLDIACSHHVRSRTEVHEGAILIEGDFFTLGNILQAFDLEGLSPLLEISRGLLSGFGLAFKDLVLLNHFLHLSLDGLEIFGAETMVLEIKVVVVTFIGRRTNVQLGLRPETCDGSGHDVGTGVTQPLKVTHLMTFIQCLAINSCFGGFHGCSIREGKVRKGAR